MNYGELPGSDSGLSVCLPRCAGGALVARTLARGAGNHDWLATVAPGIVYGIRAPIALATRTAN